MIKKINPTYKDNTKIFDKWEPVVPIDTTEVGKGNGAEDTDLTHDTFTATYIAVDKIIDVTDPDTNPVKDGYIRFIFEANTKDNLTTGKIGKNQEFIFDVLKGTRFSDSDLQKKISGIKPIADDIKLKFDGWNPTVLIDNTLVEAGLEDDVKTRIYNATYTAKDKFIDVTDPGSEVPDGYVRFIFNGSGKDTENNTITGKAKSLEEYAFDVVKGTAFNDKDLQGKIDAITAKADDLTYKFKAWDPEVKNDETLVDADDVTQNEYFASYEKKDKIVDITDPNTEIPEGYQRLTFDAQAGKISGKEKVVIDVLNGTEYTDSDLVTKLESIKENGATPNDNTQKFSHWTPAIPENGTVETRTFYAIYMDKDKIVDVDPTNPGDLKEGYIRFIFDANTKDNSTTGKIEDKQKVIFDVLKTTKFNDEAIQAKIDKITAVPNDKTKAFDKWDPEVPNNDDLVENGATNDAHTYNATYKNKDKIVDVPTDKIEDKTPEGYVRLIFDAKEGKIREVQKVAFDVLEGTKYSDNDLQGKISELKPTTNDLAKKFNGWDTPVPKDETPVVSKTYNATYTGKDKIVDVTDPNVDPKPDYVRLTFNAAEGTIAGKDTKVIDVLRGTNYYDKELQAKIKGIVAVPTDSNKKFNAWDPAVPVEDKAVETATYTAIYVDRDKIIDVTNPKVDPEESYVRLTFDAKAGTIDGKATKAIDVLAGTKYSDNDLKTKIASITAVPNDNTMKFKAWEPIVPTDETLVGQGQGTDNTEDTFTASYEKKDLIKDVIDPTVDPEEGYVRITLDPTSDGRIGNKEAGEKVAIDVLRGTDYSNETLKNKINGIEVKPNDTTKEFNKWIGDIPTSGPVTTTTYYASYKVIPVEMGKVKIVYVDEDNKELAEDLRLEATEKYPAEKQGVLGADIPTEEYAKSSAPKFLGYEIDTATIEPQTDAKYSKDTDAPTITFKYKKLEDVITKGDKPEGYVTVEFLPGANGTITGTTKFFVNPKAGIKNSGLEPMPSVKAKDGFELADPLWSPDFLADAEITKDAIYTAQYVKVTEKTPDIVPGTEEKPDGYVTVTFDLDGKGTTIDSTSFHVNPNKEVSLTAPKVTANTGYKFTGWDKGLKGTFKKDTKITATYKALDNIVPGKDEKGNVNTKPDGYVTISFVAGSHASLEGTTIYYVNPKANVKNSQLKEPTIKPENGYKVDTPKWIPEFNTETVIIKDATYVVNVLKEGVNPSPTSFEITYISGNPLGGRVSPKSETVDIDGRIEGSTATAYDGYKFVKWIDSSGNTVSTSEKFVPTDRIDASYIAVFKEINTPTPNPDMFKINYISGNPLGGRVSPKSETVNIDSRIEGSTATAYDGYRFVKWTDWDGNTVSRREYFRPSERADATYIAVFERIDTPVEPKPENPSIIYATKTEEVIKEVPVFYDIHDSYIAGYPDGTVRPDGNITRAEVATIFARLTQRQNLAQFTDKFSDVKATDWFMTSVMKLSSKDIINGYPDKTFKPNRNISRAEFAAIASKFIERPTASSETFIDVPTNHWAHDKIAMVKAEGWITGYTDGTFKPDAPITRAEAVTIVNRMFDRAADRQFVKNNGYEITLFKDLSTNHWAYYDIIESTNGHYYKRANGMEDWGKIIK
ncbi:S-layer homology domain-containing protein [Peptoniphilus sp.]|uniref:S-layer homology domain-containing protein n=1 Tax=Peptoniphilus sp. TaxID=1971214 RepID=UPI003D923AC9